MSIITISRGSYSHGKEVAEKVAGKLGYECVAREVLLEASEHFNIPEMKLTQAMRNAPSLLDRFLYGKEKYVAYIRAALLNRFRKDNVVYHGMAGHFFVRGVPHVLKVRIIADLDERVKIVMERDKVSRKEALRSIKKIDDERNKWGRHLYGIDTSDSSLYDLVLHIRKFTVDDAVELICSGVRLEQFRTTPESQRIMEDLALAAEVTARLIEVKPDVEIFAQDGSILVKTKAHESQQAALSDDIQRLVKGIPGVKEIRVQMLPVTPFEL
jgi:cytidylate kinase